MSDTEAPTRARPGRERLTAAVGLTLAAAVGMSFIYAMHRARRVPVDALWERALASHDTDVEEERRVLAPDAARALDPADVIHHLRGSAPGDWFGWATTGTDDLDGDGVRDFAVGAFQNRNFGTVAERKDPGYVHVFSSRTGARLHTLVPEGSGALDAADDHFGARLSGVDDLDGDGVGDLLVGAYLYDALDDGPDDDENSGAAMLYSGATGELIHLLPGFMRGDLFGMEMLPYPDRDGDGTPDLLISIQKAEARRGLINAGTVGIYSGADFTLLSRVLGPGWDAHMGTSLAVLDDRDADGLPEFAAGAHKFGSGTDRASDWHKIGAVGLFDPASSELLRAWRGDRALDRFGYAVQACADASGDGAPELAVGAPQSFYGGGDVGAGYVRVVDPRTGRSLVRIEGTLEGGQFGWALERADDLNGDRVDDLLVGSPGGVAIGEPDRGLHGRVYAFCGATFEHLATVHGPQLDDQFGIHLRRVGDVDGDGRADYVIGAPENDAEQSRAGSAYLVSGRAFVPADR